MSTAQDDPDDTPLYDTKSELVAWSITIGLLADNVPKLWLQKVMTLYMYW